VEQEGRDGREDGDPAVVDEIFSGWEVGEVLGRGEFRGRDEISEVGDDSWGGDGGGRGMEHGGDGRGAGGVWKGRGKHTQAHTHTNSSRNGYLSEY
jgi:hypothetical protein